MSRIHVKKGQIYRVPRPGKPYRTIQVVRVRNLKARTPEAILQETTRGGRLKGEPFRTVLTCNGDRTGGSLRVIGRSILNGTVV